MTRHPARHRLRRSRDDRGVVLVEAALIFPIVFMFVFGLVTFGLALGQRNSLENAARESSRFGATRPVSVVKDWLDAVHGVAVSAATGEMDAGVSDRYICVALVGTDDHDGRRESIGSASPAYYSSGGCPRQPGGTDIVACPSTEPCVQVVLRRSVRLDAVAFQRSVMLDSVNISAFERES